MELDLGAIGKGWAVDAAIERLVELGVTSALLHGGTSSVHVLGRPEDEPSWRVGWRIPGEVAPRILDLRAALSVSAPHGKAFEADGCTFGHVLDPRSGQPVAGPAAAAVRGPSSTVCDALSTGLLVLGDGGRRMLADLFPDYTLEVSSVAATPMR